MTPKQPYDFPESSYGPMAIRLTDVSGLYNATGKPTQISAARPSFFKLSATGAETLKFYTDYNGSKHFMLTDTNIAASEEVTLAVRWMWDIGDGIPREKFAYTMSLNGTQAKNGVSTDYPWIEDVPPGTLSWIEVDTGGACDVSVNAMGRYHL